MLPNRNVLMPASIAGRAMLVMVTLSGCYTAHLQDSDRAIDPAAHDASSDGGPGGEPEGGVGDAFGGGGRSDGRIRGGGDLLQEGLAL